MSDEDEMCVYVKNKVIGVATGEICAKSTVRLKPRMLVTVIRASYIYNWIRQVILTELCLAESLVIS